MFVKISRTKSNEIFIYKTLELKSKNNSDDEKEEQFSDDEEEEQFSDDE